MGYIETATLKHQQLFIASDAKYPALVAGLGSGKTEALIYRTLALMTRVPSLRMGLYEPTVDLIKRILYPRFEEIFANSGMKYKLNKSDGVMEVWMPTGKVELIFRSMDNYARIIGYETHHAILDEIDTIPKDKANDVWIRVLARNRKRFKDNYTGDWGKNTVGITTTPEGFNFVYNLWVKEHPTNPDYQLIRGKTADNYHLDSDYVPSLMRTYPPQLIKAYLEGEFINLKGNTVYDGFNRVHNHTNLTTADFPMSQMMHIGMDFNIGRMGATVGFKEQGDKQLYITDEFHNLMDTPTMINAILQRYPKHMITIYPDASGASRKSVDASKSDIRLLRDAGFRINAPRKNPPVRERVLSTNTMFLNGEGERHLYVNTTTCVNLTEALEKQIYDDNGMPIKDGKEDINDALGYLTNRVFGLAKPMTTIGRMRMGM